MRLGAGRWGGEVGFWQAAVEGRHGGRQRGQQGAVGAADVALPHQGEVAVGVLLHGAEAGPGVRGPRDGGQVGAEGGVAGGRHQAPPRRGVSVGAGAEGGVEALGAQAGAESHSGGDAVLPALFLGVWSGAGDGRGETQEVGKRQVVFVQEAALVVGSGALRPAQELKEFCNKTKTNHFNSSEYVQSWKKILVKV